MSSSEPIICGECGQIFDTIESLREHQETEREEKELRNKGIDD
jgi:predicted nucleic acid-binding Zn ribbon protein